MTEAEATATMEATLDESSVMDVKMTDVDPHPQSDVVVTSAPDATLAAQIGTEEAEQSATPPAASSLEETATVVASSPSSTAPSPVEETKLSEPKSEASPALDETAVASSADVKMEDTAEEASLTKQDESDALATKPGAARAQNNNESTDEPTAKRLKGATKPSNTSPPPPVATPVATPLATAVSAPLMMSRDDMAKVEEDTGLLKFDVITNDGTPEHMVQLTTLKNIFARQLPKMPREYIVRLVFDRNHRSMVILKNSKQVIGGICYRPFEANHFGEIAFCAINAADQVKGYGTRLMNHLKEYVKAAGITHFLTYADNYAIGYFKKQGFAKVVSMPRPNWFGYIKDYDGGTLMECTIHHQINYLRITSMVHAQRKKIQDKIKERSHADIMYPGLTKFAEGRTMDLYMIPGVQEAGWTRAVIRNSRVGTRDPGSLKTQLQQVWKAVASHRSAWPFNEPVDTTIVIDYLDYIKEPVDLTLIQKRIESGHYLSKVAFKEDLDKMCNNCMIYNTPDTNYYKAAKDLQEFVDKRVQVAKER